MAADSERTPSPFEARRKRGSHLRVRATLMLGVAALGSSLNNDLADHAVLGVALAVLAVLADDAAVLVSCPC
jgi:hypothetical protein